MSHEEEGPDSHPQYILGSSAVKTHKEHRPIIEENCFRLQPIFTGSLPLTIEIVLSPHSPLPIEVYRESQLLIRAAPNKDIGCPYNRAPETQSRCNRGRFYIAALKLDTTIFYLDSQAMTASIDNRAMLGELFYKAGLINIAQLCQVLCIAHKNSLPVGRVLTMVGLTKHKTIEDALKLQNLVRQNVLAYELAIEALRQVSASRAGLAAVLQDLGWQGNVDRDEENLGSLLVEAGILTQKSIEDSLGLSRHIGLPLARVLVLQGLVTASLLGTALSAQTLIRSGRADRNQTIRALSSANSLTISTNSNCDIALINSRAPYIRLDELLLLAGLLSDSDVKKFMQLEESDCQRTLGEEIVESGMFSSSLIAAAVRLQTMMAKHQVTPDRAARALKLVFSKNISLTKALKEILRESDPYDGNITLYHLLRLSGLVTAYDIRRLGHLPAHPEGGTGSLEERLIKTGIVNRSALDAAKRCLLLTQEGFLTAEQAMIVLHHWSWSGEGLTRVLEKLQWAGGNRLLTLKAQAFVG